ncbi:unnamed protein product [Pleuronectes platessa]|uniref:Uncharacterized protein n=1 Tax=Pleuronectes platessa TaxID=8262 RepID=A0A9N7U2G1_PLEPL|nr:unnamed protein product [Pleuronectes platessa]
MAQRSNTGGNKNSKAYSLFTSPHWEAPSEACSALSMLRTLSPERCASQSAERERTTRSEAGHGVGTGTETTEKTRESVGVTADRGSTDRRTSCPATHAVDKTGWVMTLRFVAALFSLSTPPPPESQQQQFLSIWPPVQKPHPPLPLSALEGQHIQEPAIIVCPLNLLADIPLLVSYLIFHLPDDPDCL